MTTKDNLTERRIRAIAKTISPKCWKKYTPGDEEQPYGLQRSWDQATAIIDADPLTIKYVQQQALLEECAATITSFAERLSIYAPDDVAAQKRAEHILTRLRGNHD